MDKFKEYLDINNKTIILPILLQGDYIQEDLMGLFMSIDISRYTTESYNNINFNGKHYECFLMIQNNNVRLFKILDCSTSIKLLDVNKEYDDFNDFSDDFCELLALIENETAFKMWLLCMNIIN